MYSRFEGVNSQCHSWKAFPGPLALTRLVPLLFFHSHQGLELFMLISLPGARGHELYVVESMYRPFFYAPKSLEALQLLFVEWAEKLIS